MNQSPWMAPLERWRGDSPRVASTREVAVMRPLLSVREMPARSKMLAGSVEEKSTSVRIQALREEASEPCVTLMPSGALGGVGSERKRFSSFRPARDGKSWENWKSGSLGGTKRSRSLKLGS